MAASLLTAVFAILATILLLGLGTLAGYQFGIRAASGSVVVVPAEAKPTATSQKAEIWLDAAEALGLKSNEIAEIAKKYRDTLPAELTMAIDQLAIISARLGRQLQSASIVANNVASTEMKSRAADSPKPDDKSDPKFGESLSGNEMRNLTGLPNADDSAKRRYPYDCYQTVYPMFGSDSNFMGAISVRCHDISVNGISFFLPEEPDFDRFVISLGHENDPVLMEASVVQSKAVYMHNKWQMLVGCRLIGRRVCQTTWPVNHRPLAPATV